MMIQVSTNDFANILAGELAFADTIYYESPARYDDDGNRFLNYQNDNLYHRGRHERNVIRNIALSMADRFRQADESFNRRLFYSLIGLNADGSLKP